MSSSTMNEDLRSIKTENALYNAMFSLLKKHSFRKITIKAICEEAYISRATFYAHFVDKYDLLRQYLAELWSNDFQYNNTYDQLEKVINGQMYNNLPVLKNLLEETDNETYRIIFDFLLSTINLCIEKNDCPETYHKNVVLSNFYAGGFISYFLWLVKHKFPPDVPPMNKYLYEMIHDFKDRQSK